MPGPQGDAGNLLQEQDVETMQYQNFPLDEEAPAAGVSNTPATPRIVGPSFTLHYPQDIQV